MSVIERTGVREREPSGPDVYELAVKKLLELRDRAFKGKIIIKGEELSWEKSRQGILKWYICREADNTNSVLKEWQVFIHDIRSHSGEHRHQGGLVIYILEGEGYTEVDGEKVEWEAGDLLLLPIKEGGVVHKHYNKRPGENCKWMAFIYRPYSDEVGSYVEQRQDV